MAWEFTDDREVTVRTPGPPRRVAAYLRAGAGLWDLGIRPVGVYGSGHDGPLPDPAKSGGLGAGDVPYLGAGDALDEAALRSVRPDLIVDVTYDREHAYAVDDAVAARAGVPVLALAVSGDVSLPRILARFSELAYALGGRGGRHAVDLAGDTPTGAGGGGGAVAVPGALGAAEAAVRAAAERAPELRVLALSAAGPAQVHLARPKTWPELRHLADLGVRLVEPGAGGVNWSTTTWDDAAPLRPDVVLADNRGNAVRPDALDVVAGWRALTADAVVVPWNPELPGSGAACAVFLRGVADGLTSAAGKHG